MSGSPSFQRVRKHSLRQAHAFQQVDIARIRAERIHRFNGLDSLQPSCFLGIRFLQPISMTKLLSRYSETVPEPQRDGCKCHCRL